MLFSVVPQYPSNPNEASRADWNNAEQQKADVAADLNHFLLKKTKVIDRTPAADITMLVEHATARGKLFCIIFC